MKRYVLGLFITLFYAGFGHAALVLHFQSPWRDDPTKAEYVPHVLGAAGGNYNAEYGANSKTIMTDEGNGWFSYTWDKVIGDFQDWMKYDIKACPNTTDANFNNNNCVSWVSSGATKYELTMAETFGTDVEVWFYTNTLNNSYSKSFMAPGSKIIWFKSPWGNKALPQMVFGADTVLMRFSNDDPSKCGWFYGAVTPKMQQENVLSLVYFQRHNAPWLVYPEKELDLIDLSSYLAILDTIYVSSDDLFPAPADAMGSLGACFDSSRVLHVYHPWRNNSTYKDSSIFISVGNNILNQPTEMNSTGEFPYWWHYSFSPATVSSSNWTSSSSLFNFYRRQNEWPQVMHFTEATRPMISTMFPQGVYETWLIPKNNSTVEIIFYPLEPKTVRLMSPWDNMSPSMLVGGDTVKMGPISKDTCGWYQGTYYKHTDSWDVVFKQTFGMEFYGEDGVNSLSPIILDTMISLFDTVWVYPYPVLNSGPRLDFTYPNRLGICPSLKISALLLDWAGESYPDSVDVDFGGIYGGNPYTAVVTDAGTYNTCGGLALGMVQDTLSSLGVPLRVDSLSFPWEICSAGRDINKWFIPVTLAKDASGKEYTNATCRDIDLSLDAEGFWLADISESSPEGGFFPLDDFEYLDSAKTIKNPKFDWDVQGHKHNFSFSMKISAQFQYIKGQYFEFRGDDDVWVFIDNKLVVDIGGCHGPIEGSVNLDTLHLIEGQTYPFHIFFSERNATGSNFKMRTSINLQTQKTYYPVELPTYDGTIEFKILQLLTDESVSCDISSVTKIDTTEAQSVFLLFGGSLDHDGVILNPGVNYGGITINDNMTGFIIDTNAIVIKRVLQPGTYVLRFYLASDLTQSSEVYFTVPAYPLPSIAFVDSLGNRLDSNATIVGNLAFVPYKVRIVVLYMDSIVCTDCLSKINLESLDSLSFFNMNDKSVSFIEIDSTGYASFYVMGLTTIVNGSVKISGGSVDNILRIPINMEEPPVPYPKNAEMHDRNGDGVPDSLIISFSSSLSGDDTPDSLSWLFGDSTWRSLTKINLPSHIKDSSIIITADSLIGEMFTGVEGSVYTGNTKTRFSFVSNEGVDSGKVQAMQVAGSIVDKIGPIVTNAFISSKADNLSVLRITFSESIDTPKSSMDSILEFRVWREGVELSGAIEIKSETRLSNGKSYDMYFIQKEGSVIPSVGDSVRFSPGVARDLSQNYPHINNPYVRIIGEQLITVDATKLITLNDDFVANDTLPVITVRAFPLTETFKNAEKTMGMPGHLIRYDLSELLFSNPNISKEQIYIQYEVFYFSNLGHYINSTKENISCVDKVFDGDCSKNPGNLYLGWNARSESKRMVGTGAYLSRLNFKINAGVETVSKKDETFTFGVKRTK